MRVVGHMSRTFEVIAPRLGGRVGTARLDASDGEEWDDESRGIEMAWACDEGGGHVIEDGDMGHGM